MHGLHDMTREDRLSGVLTLEILACTHIRVGSGVSEPVPADGKLEIAAGLAHVRGRPVIPGSSLKGTLRSLCEAIGGGCELDERCDPPCRICSLFGQVSKRRTLMGRIGFGDAMPVKRSDADIGLIKLPRAFQPRKETGRRLYGAAPPGMTREIPHEVILKGARYRGQVFLTNITEAELGLVLLAGGLDRTFRPRIGGGKYGGLGLVELHLSEATLRRGYRSPRTEQLSGAPLDEIVQRCLAAAIVAPGGEEALAALRGSGR